MKRVVAVTMVKNESDIIESFLRHTCSFCDAVLVCDDGSADGTRGILEKLIAEGLAVIPSNGGDTLGHRQDSVITRLALKARAEHGAGVILPLDADEFLYGADGKSPRALLETVEPDRVYSIRWPVFLPSDAEKENGVYLPAFFNEYISQTQFNKIVFGADVLELPGAGVAKGNHALLTAAGPKDAPLLENAVLAHIPVRSAEQIMAKAIVGWANTLSTAGRSPGDSAHWGDMYRHIKENGYVAAAELEGLARVYAFGSAEPGRIMELGADFTLRYTDYGAARRDFFKIILTNYERIIAALMER